MVHFLAVLMFVSWTFTSKNEQQRGPGKGARLEWLSPKFNTKIKNRGKLQTSPFTPPSLCCFFAAGWTNNICIPAIGECRNAHQNPSNHALFIQDINDVSRSETTWTVRGQRKKRLTRCHTGCYEGLWGGNFSD